jgi:hypothetical protein
MGLLYATCAKNAGRIKTTILKVISVARFLKISVSIENEICIFAVHITGADLVLTA